MKIFSTSSSTPSEKTDEVAEQSTPVIISVEHDDDRIAKLDEVRRLAFQLKTLQPEIETLLSEA